MHQSGCVVRVAEIEDLDRIFFIEESSFPDPYPRGLLKAFFFMPCAYLVALEGSEIVGYGIGIIRYGTVGHVVSIAILGGHQGKGIGETLLRRLLEELGTLGATQMKLEVRVSNQKAIGLYRKVGFEEGEKIENYYADGESALVMRLNWSRCPRR